MGGPDGLVLADDRAVKLFGATESLMPQQIARVLKLTPASSMTLMTAPGMPNAFTASRSRHRNATEPR